MKALLSAIAMAALWLPTNAQAQGVNLTGQYRCVRLCPDGLVGGSAYVTQNGWNLRLSNPVGTATYAWVDYPGHIWVENWHEGALYSPDGMAIQFDRGSVWQRDIGQFDDVSVVGPPLASTKRPLAPVAPAAKRR